MKPLLIMGLCLGAACAGHAQTNNDQLLQGQQPCIQTQLSLQADSKDVNVTPGLATRNDKVFVYYHRRKARHDYATGQFADLPDNHASKPLLVNEKDVTKVLPTAYNISVSTPQQEVTACQDSTLNIQANISAEQQSEFTGNYPDAKTQKNIYVRVSKHHYRQVERKIARVEKKERKITRRTGVTVAGV